MVLKNGHIILNTSDVISSIVPERLHQREDFKDRGKNNETQRALKRNLYRVLHSR